MFKRPGSVSKSAFGVNYDSSRQQQQPAGNAPRADGPPSKRARTEQLPAEQVRRELLYLVENHATVVVVGETGCGKTTQIPRFLHEAGWTADGYQVWGRGHPFWLSLWGWGWGGMLHGHFRQTTMALPTRVEPGEPHKL